MWLDRGEENRVVFLLFSCYMRKLRVWFALLFALLVIPTHAHTCWVHTFSSLSWERTVHYMIVLIPTVFLPYALVSNCYLVMIFFIFILYVKKFEFTLHAHSLSFANIIILFRLGTIHVVFLSYCYWERTKLKWKMYMIHPVPNKNWSEFQNFHIHPHSAVDSVRLGHYVLYSRHFYCIFTVFWLFSLYTMSLSHVRWDWGIWMDQ